MFFMKRISSVFMLFFAIACNNAKHQEPVKNDSVTQISVTAYQQEVKGKKVDLYVLTNKNKMSVFVTNYG